MFFFSFNRSSVLEDDEKNNQSKFSAEPENGLIKVDFDSQFCKRILENEINSISNFNLQLCFHTNTNQA